ncbi:MAG: glycoside hydrolase family 30 beta sandwich domain-containing protein [Lachnospiraceae bacterium]
MKVVTTNIAKNQLWDEQTVDKTKMEDCMHVVNVYPDLLEQEIEGFGGAFTEACAHTFDHLEEESKEAFVQSYFGEHGLGYNLCRVSIHSCDFGLGNYTYIEEGDAALETFSIAHDEKEIIPLIHRAQACSKDEISFLASPWSPPAFMKTTNKMNEGGKLLAKYYEAWANYYVKFITAYKAQGIEVRYITVQNEPMAVQTWDSCIYESLEEGAFVKNYLARALKENGLGDVQIFVWDHNKEEMYQRVKETFSVDGVEQEVSGIAIHWYTGDHFDAIRATKKAYPDKRIFFTEGCVEYSRFEGSSDVHNAEMYAHDILGNLKAGCEAFIDWNMLLDVNGGPNHVGNFCAAPIMEDGTGGITKRLTYYYIGHFSKYIKKGARQCMTSCYTDGIEVFAAVNLDGSKVVVLLNKEDRDVEVTLREVSVGHNFVMEAHTIKTIIF